MGEPELAAVPAEWKLLDGRTWQLWPRLPWRSDAAIRQIASRMHHALYQSTPSLTMVLTQRQNGELYIHAAAAIDIHGTELRVERFGCRYSFCCKTQLPPRD